MADESITNTSISTTTDVPPRPEYMLTTYDNPYDPFTQWDEWYAWDRDAGYDTPGLLARLSNMSNDLSDADQHAIIQDTVDEIVKINASGVHMKVTKEIAERLTPSTLPLP